MANANDNDNDNDNHDYMYDKWDKAYEKHCTYKDNGDSCNDGDDCDYDADSYDDDSYNSKYKYTFSDYEELLTLTKHQDTEYTINNILFTLIKLITIKKTKEVSFKFDFKLSPYKNWLDIAEYFNSNYVGTDYRILIDEDSIVCRLLNDDLIA